MRSRTEMVTTTLDGSDFEEDSDFEDSEEDWKPEKGEQKGLKRKSRDIIGGSVGRRSGAGRSNGKRRGRKPAAKGRAGRKRKSGDPSDEDDDDDDDNDDEEEDDDLTDTDDGARSAPSARKRGRSGGSKAAGPKRSNGRKGPAKTLPSTSKRASSSELALTPIARKVVNLASSFPDKSGNLKLYAFRGDLEEGIRDNLKVCLWRRDGSSLLQKYFRDKSVDACTPQFTSSMVYSCWEDKRSDEYMEVKVRCIEQTKQLRVQVIDVDAVDKKAKEEYEKFIAQRGTAALSAAGGAGGRSNGSGRGAASRGRKANRVQNEEVEEEEEDEDADEDESEKDLEDDPAEADDEDGAAPGEEGAAEDDADAARMEEEKEEPPQEE